jgi:hypothetical protein
VILTSVPRDGSCDFSCAISDMNSYIQDAPIDSSVITVPAIEGSPVTFTVTRMKQAKQLLELFLKFN